jgi:hypothetical protein
MKLGPLCFADNEWVCHSGDEVGLVPADTRIH